MGKTDKQKANEKAKGDKKNEEKTKGSEHYFSINDGNACDGMWYIKWRIKWKRVITVLGKLQYV